MNRKVLSLSLALGLSLSAVVSAEAALTTESCLAKKLKEWGKLRNCQAKENGKALQGKPADPARCQTRFDDKLGKLSAQATAAAIACRYGVNGDGTATDYDTGLQWEQKTDDSTVHDKDNLYTWSDGGGAFSQPDGKVFKVFLGTLNNGLSGNGSATIGGCFAEHCDWRLPLIEELPTIVDLSAPGCGPIYGPACIDQTVFGPTAGNFYWSATTFFPDDPSAAWSVAFDGGFVFFGSKTFDGCVRAVRSRL